MKPLLVIRLFDQFPGYGRVNFNGVLPSASEIRRFVRVFLLRWGLSSPSFPEVKGPCSPGRFSCRCAKMLSALARGLIPEMCQQMLARRVFKCFSHHQIHVATLLKGLIQTFSISVASHVMRWYWPTIDTSFNGRSDQLSLKVHQPASMPTTSTVTSSSRLGKLLPSDLECRSR